MITDFIVMEKKIVKKFTNYEIFEDVSDRMIILHFTLQFITVQLYDNSLNLIFRQKKAWTTSLANQDRVPDHVTCTDRIVHQFTMLSNYWHC